MSNDNGFPNYLPKIVFKIIYTKHSQQVTAFTYINLGSLEAKNLVATLYSTS